jgi:GntR family transcriptional regulator
VSPRLPVPKYHQVYLVLRQHLDEGRYAAGLPGELALTREFGVARVTVRRALEQLAAEGLIKRSPGRGTAVVPPPAAAELPTPLTSGLLENIVSMGLRTSVQVMDCQLLPAPDAVARQLDIEPGHRCRRRCACAAPATARCRTSPPTCRPSWRSASAGANWRRSPSCCCWRPPAWSSAARCRPSRRAWPTPRWRRCSRWTSARRCWPWSRLVRDADDRPVQWLQGLYRPDRYQYEMQLSRVGSIDAKVWVSTDLAAPFH